MELLSAFIPADRQLALACGETLPDQAVGAVLFADLSGFTPFTEAITTALGPQRGAEVITAWLNLIFEALIAEVSAFGGSVITFSGDAITCWFGARPGRQGAPLDMAHAARRAVAAALACQRAIERVNSGPMPAGISAALGLKAAVATGSTRRFVVGDPAFQLIDVLAGSTLDRLAEAEQLARRGEVLIAAEVVADLDASLRISGWRTDEHSGELYAVVEALVEVVAPAPLEPVGPQALREEQARPWLLPAVYERLRSGQGDFLAELRPATALFMRFGGINYDADPQAGARLNAFVRWVQGIVGHYEGFVLQLTMGDKGSYLYAAFGAPIAHADDTARAAAAAQALRQLPSELSFIDRPQIGLSQGVMYCGPYGAATRRTYGVFGDEVNTAARLMQVAQPGQIICTERVASLLRHRAVLHPKGAISVKGKQQPVALFELGERADHHTVASTAADDGELFGREQELAQLVDRLRAATERGASAAVLLSGEAGIGKSRLLAATRDAALAAGARVLSGFSDAIERATPYLAWRPVFSELLDLADAPEDPAARASFVRARLAFDPDLPELAPLLNPVLAADMPESELSAQLSGQVRADNTVRLLVALLGAAAANQPLAVFVEDGHWLDSASWALARAVAEQVRPLLLVISTRPLEGELSPDARRLSDHPDTTSITLQPLAPAEVLALVRSRLGVRALPELMGELIVARAEGHPFFSEELAYAMRERGLITIAAGECRIAPEVDLSHVSFPDTVQGVITSRIDRLPPQHQTTLKVASVVGRMFAFRILAAIHPIDGDRALLPVTLHALDELRFTRVETPEPDLQYLFRHVLTREVAYNTLLFSQRRTLHRTVAEWYERSVADDLAPYYAVLAYHWRQALGDEADQTLLAKTITYMEHAGEQAFRTYANQESVSLFGELLRLADAHPTLSVDAARRGRWEGRLAEAYLGLGKLQESRDHFHRALALLGYPPAEKPLAQARSLLREVAIQAGHRLWPAGFIGRERGRRDELVHIAHMLQQVAKLYFYRSESVPLLTVNICGLNLVERVGDPTPELASLYASLCAISGLVSQHGLAVRYGELAWAAAERIDDRPAHGWVALATGLYYVGIGGWERAETLLLQALDLFDRLGDRRQWEESCSVLAPVYFFQGRLDRTVELRVATFASARRRGDQQTQIWSAVGEAECALRRGDPAAALALIERVRPLIGENEDALWTLGVAAVATWRAGRHAEALRIAGAATRLLGRFQPTAAQVLGGYLGLAEVYLGLWERSPAAGRAPALRRAAASALRGVATFARTFPLGRPGLHRVRGLQAWLRGDQRAAHRHWARSLAEAQRLGMPYEQAEAHLAIGRHPLAPADTAHLAAAQLLLDGMGGVAPAR